jgi:alpha-glucosidase
MPWDAHKPNLGFTSGTPWLPLSPKHRALAISEQERNPQSALNFAHRFLAFRRTSAPLRWGEIAFLDAKPPLLAFTRECAGEQLLCLFNMGAEAAEFTHELLDRCSALPIGTSENGVSNSAVQLAPYAAWFGSCSKASSTASMGSNTQR